MEIISSVRSDIVRWPAEYAAPTEPEMVLGCDFYKYVAPMGLVYVNSVHHLTKPRFFLDKILAGRKVSSVK